MPGVAKIQHRQVRAEIDQSYWIAIPLFVTIELMNAKAKQLQTVRGELNNWERFVDANSRSIIGATGRILFFTLPTDLILRPGLEGVRRRKRLIQFV